MRLRIPPTDDDHVLVDNAGRGQHNRLLLVVPTQVLAQIDAAALAKTLHRLPGLRVQAVEIVHDPREDAPLLAVGPIGHPARRLVAANAGVELPNNFAGCSVEGNKLLRRRVGVKRAPHDERIVLDAALFAGVEAPRQFEQLHVGPVDLLELGIMVAVEAAVVDRPTQRALPRAECASHSRHQ